MPPSKYTTHCPFSHNLLKTFFSFKSGVGELVQQLRVLLLAEGQISVPSTHVVAYSHPNSVLGHSVPFLDSVGIRHAHIYMKAKTFIYIRWNLFNSFRHFLHWICLPWNRIRELITTFESTGFASFVACVHSPSLWEMRQSGPHLWSVWATQWGPVS